MGNANICSGEKSWIIRESVDRKGIVLKAMIRLDEAVLSAADPERGFS